MVNIIVALMISPLLIFVAIWNAIARFCWARH